MAVQSDLYIALKREGRGPREIRLGKCVLISPQAEADWHRDREAETMAESDLCQGTSFRNPNRKKEWK